MGLYKRKGYSTYTHEFTLFGERYKLSTGRRTLKEAKLVAEKQRRDLQDARQLGTGEAAEMTLGDAMERYTRLGRHQDEAHRYADRTRKLFGETLKGGVVKRVRFGLKRTLPLHAITNATVADLVAARVAEGMKPRTINRELSFVSAMWHLARNNWEVRVDGRLSWSRHLIPVKGIPRPLSDDEVLRFLAELTPANQLKKVLYRAPDIAAAPRRAQDNYDFAVFLLDTGMRHSEAAEITWDKIELNRGVISVFRPKVKKESLIGISERLRTLLTRRYQNRGTPWVFANDTQSGPRAHWASRALCKAMDRAGINSPDKVQRYGSRSVHQLRDTFATRVGRKVGILGIKGLLGHASVRTAEKYTDLISDKLAFDAAEALNAT